jgi:hypothetical protein
MSAPLSDERLSILRDIHTPEGDTRIALTELITRRKADKEAPMDAGFAVGDKVQVRKVKRHALYVGLDPRHAGHAIVAYPGDSCSDIYSERIENLTPVPPRRTVMDVFEDALTSVLIASNSGHAAACDAFLATLATLGIDADKEVAE